MDFFSGGLQSHFITLYSQFYHFAGYTELYVPFFAFLFFVLEYTTRHFYSEKQKVIEMRKVWFSFILLFWLLLFVLKFKNQFFSNYSTKVIIDGVEQSVDFSLGYFISSLDFKIIIFFIFIYQIIFLIICLSLVNKKILSRPDFVEQKYWINAVEILFFFIIAYFLVGFIKVLMGRNYYKSLNYVLDNRAELFAQMYGFNVENVIINYQDIEYYPWWKPNGLIGNPNKIIDILKNNIGTIFTANAFPSGHMAATGMVGYMVFSLILKGGVDESCVNKKSITLFWIFNLHMLLMDISFLINGSHWQTDLSFTWMWVIATIVFVQFISLRLNRKYK